MSNQSPSSQSKPKRRSRAAWRDQLYVIIFEADTRAGQLFDLGLLVAIILSITVIALETVEYFETSQAWMEGLEIVEWVLTLLFTAEYIARLICSPRPLRYAFSYFGIIDLLACLPLYMTLFQVNSKSWMIVRAIRLLRVFRVLKMMRLVREAHELKLAVWKSRGKILVFLSVVMVAVTMAGTLMYHVEHIEAPPVAGAENSNQAAAALDLVFSEGEPAEPSLQAAAESPNQNASNAPRPVKTRIDQFSSIPQSMYWAIVTMATVGYGDIVPRTAIGKVISAALILLGYSLIVVPTGVVTAEMQSQGHRKDTSLRVCPHCLCEGHAADALYCDQCGQPLIC